MNNWQNEIKIPYELLTLEQKTEICNGCGGKGSWVKPPLKAFYRTSCNHHDYGYWCGVTEEVRKACDQKLRRNMRKDCKKLSFIKKFIYRPWCSLYYVAVRLKGSEYFYWGTKKRWPIPTKEQLLFLKTF